MVTHPFFISKGLNVIVFNLTQPEEEKSSIDFWLQSIYAYTPDAPAILVGTHSEDKKCTPEYVMP